MDQYRYRRLFKVLCVPEETETDLLEHPKIPALGSQHPRSSEWQCARIDAVRVLPDMFDVEVRYEPRNIN